MAKKSAPKTNKPRIGQQTKTSAKGAHGGGVKFSQVTLGPGFKNETGKGINAGKTAAKLPKAKTNIAESNTPMPKVMLGKGFVASNVTEAVKTKGKKSASKMRYNSKDKKMPAVKPKKGK
jgi:hypothetical protein